MAQRSMRPPKGGNIKKGICENHQYLNPDTGETGDCPKCASGEIQSVNVQRLSDFRCSVCGAKLSPVKESFLQKNGKLLIYILIALCAVVGGYLLISSISSTEATTEQTTDPDEGESNNVSEPTTEDPANEEEPEQSPEPVIEDDNSTAPPNDPTPETQPKTVLGGAAKLEQHNGYTDIVFLKDYTLDLGKTDGKKLYIRKGEIIERADIRHNVLRGGNYINLSKEENSLSGLNVKL